MEMKVNNEDQQRKSTKINVYKTRKIIINGTRPKRKSTMKIADGNHHVCGTKINMGNVNYHE